MLIADLLLSDGNGLNLATHLAARKNALPVLLVTGYAEDRASWDVIRERGYRIIQKPYRVTALLRAVKELLSNGHAHAGMAVSAVGASHA